jgi:hypothetical protein
MSAPALVPGTAAAAGGSSTGVSVSLSPVRLEADVPTGPYTFPVTIANRGPVAAGIQLASATLNQAAGGAPTFGPPGSAPLAISTPTFDLGPGQQRSVPVTATITSATAGLYAAVLATVGPVNPPPGNILSRERLAALVELTGPGTAHRTATISDIGAAGGRQSGQVTFSALVRDSGNVLISPTGTAQISSGADVLATVPLGTQRILPGSAVTFSGAWDSPAALNGPVSVHVDLTDPGADATTEVVFHAGAAPILAARITDLRAEPTTGGATVSLRLANDGNTALAGTVTTAVFDGHSYATAATTQVGALAPRQVRSLEQAIRLKPGTYELSIRAQAGGKTLDQRQITVKIPGPSSGTPILLVVLVALAAAMVLVGLVVRRRKHRSQRRNPAGTGREAAD